jgi:hypothetical protein
VKDSELSNAQKAWVFTVAVLFGVGSAFVAEEVFQDNPTRAVSIPWPITAVDPGKQESVDLDVPDHLTRLSFAVHLTEPEQTDGGSGACPSKVRLDAGPGSPANWFSDNSSVALPISSGAVRIHVTATLSYNQDCPMVISSTDATFHN